jgi:hypothetical protein
MGDIGFHLYCESQSHIEELLFSKLCDTKKVLQIFLLAERYRSSRGRSSVFVNEARKRRWANACAG